MIEVRSLSVALPAEQDREEGKEPSPRLRRSTWRLRSRVVREDLADCHPHGGWSAVVESYQYLYETMALAMVSFLKRGFILWKQEPFELA